MKFTKKQPAKKVKDKQIILDYYDQKLKPKDLRLLKKLVPKKELFIRSTI